MEPGDWSQVIGQRLMREALLAHPEITGVFAAGDGMALGALDAIAAAGRSLKKGTISCAKRSAAMPLFDDSRLSPHHAGYWGAQLVVHKIADALP